ncbi:MAG: hypothetical protein R6W91_01580 [Thermoplasmata archaeon]
MDEPEGETAESPEAEEAFENDSEKLRELVELAHGFFSEMLQISLGKLGLTNDQISVELMMFGVMNDLANKLQKYVPPEHMESYR